VPVDGIWVMPRAADSAPSEDGGYLSASDETWAPYYSFQETHYSDVIAEIIPHACFGENGR
jgi:hypothetical protein